MSDPTIDKPGKPTTSPDSLAKAGQSSGVELAESELDQASGGSTNDVTVNKAKTADKAFNAMDGYIRG